MLALAARYKTNFSKGRFSVASPLIPKWFHPQSFQRQNQSRIKTPQALHIHLERNNIVLHLRLLAMALQKVCPFAQAYYPLLDFLSSERQAFRLEQSDRPVHPNRKIRYIAIIIIKVFFIALFSLFYCRLVGLSGQINNIHRVFRNSHHGNRKAAFCAYLVIALQFPSMVFGDMYFTCCAGLYGMINGGYIDIASSMIAANPDFTNRSSRPIAARIIAIVVF